MLRFHHALDTNRHRGGAMRDLMRLGTTNNLRERMLEDAEKFVRHFGFRPHKGLQTLHPLKVRDDHAAGVTQDVGDDENFVPASVKNEIGLGRSRAIGAFGENAALQFRRIFLVDHAIDRAWCEHIAWHGQHLFWVNVIVLSECTEISFLDHVLFRGRDIDPSRIVKRHGGIADSDNFHPGLERER